MRDFPRRARRVGFSASRQITRQRRQRRRPQAQWLQVRERGYQPEIRTAFEPGTWKPDACYEEMKGAVASFTDYEVPFVERRHTTGREIFKLDDSGRAVFKPNRKGTLGPTFVVQAWFKQANLALAQLKDAASNFIFMAGPPRVEAR